MEVLPGGQVGIDGNVLRNVSDLRVAVGGSGGDLLAGDSHCAGIRFEDA